MTTTTPAPAPPTGVVGDGTTARSRASRRWRRARFPLAIGAVLVVIGLLAALPEPRTSSTPLAPDNPAPVGSRALAQILGDHGVRVEYTQRFADVLDADRPGLTVAVLGDTMLLDDQVEALRDMDADLVLVDAPWAASVVAGVEAGYSDAGDDERSPSCDDPDALAAGTIVTSGTLSAGAASSGVTLCFPASGDPAGTGAYAVTEVDGRRVAVLAGAELLTNRSLATAGNAALALRVLGRGEDLVWYIPSWQDPWNGSTSDDDAPTSTMPPWTGPLMLMLGLVALVAAVWRGRRFGPLVVERLPVVVRSGETTRGRGRLYRRGRAHGHAAAALRAAAASRCATRLGLPRSAGAAELVDAIAHAVGRDPRQVADLLYGPPPHDDPGLARLAAYLDDLESEVHRS
ncbi:DUF4350 domain-containing protein [Cellulomonas persica]|uniref:DUF4350 domain-containing protein n=1 Tax=Cellulomonas persica TaxID=76861 RepID=A0A510UR87_9CELL|nr:DUF4350 domain-containing protein [Cellulomonas persica]GEK17184.1 hypothetical protein CPE01_09170 [Cellulomonas persica]